METIKLKFYSDPGHGWAAVKRKFLEDLGILDRISTFSYQKGKTVYLEEDCDLSTLTSALSMKGIAVDWQDKHTNKYSPIRSYHHFSTR